MGELPAGCPVVVVVLVAAMAEDVVETEVCSVVDCLVLVVRLVAAMAEDVVETEVCNVVVTAACGREGGLIALLARTVVFTVLVVDASSEEAAVELDVVLIVPETVVDKVVFVIDAVIE